MTIGSSPFSAPSVPVYSAPRLKTTPHTVYQGEVFLYPSMSTKLVAQYLQWVRSGGASPAYADLTGREVEVLRLIAEGHTNAEIGDMLKLSPHTVQTHRRNIMEKLKLHDRVELVKYAMRRGLIE